MKVSRVSTIFSAISLSLSLALSLPRNLPEGLEGWDLDCLVWVRSFELWELHETPCGLHVSGGSQRYTQILMLLYMHIHTCIHMYTLYSTIYYIYTLLYYILYTYIFAHCIFYVIYDNTIILFALRPAPTIPPMHWP